MKNTLIYHSKSKDFIHKQWFSSVYQGGFPPVQVFIKLNLDMEETQIRSKKIIEKWEKEISTLKKK